MPSKLSELNAKEREALLKMLKQLGTEGQSEIYNDLKYSDYKEIPVDIETFITDKKYLGNTWIDSKGNLKLYPYWLKVLKQLFPDNTSTSVNTLLESGARGLGKSEVAVIVALYILYRAICLKDPISFFHLKSNDHIFIAFMNITQAAAEKIAVSKFAEAALASPWFMAHGERTSYNSKPFWRPPLPFEIIIGSQSSDVIGIALLYCFFDEISFMRNKAIEDQISKAKDMLSTAWGSMKTRFVYQGVNRSMMVVASSKRSDVSFMEVQIKTMTENEPENIIVVDKAVWEVKPPGTYGTTYFKVAVGNKFLSSLVIPDADQDNPQKYIDKGYKILEVPIKLKPDFREDLERSLCDFAGISSSNISKYISGESVTQCINPSLENPFSRDILEIGNGADDLRQYYHFFDIDKIPSDLKKKPLYIHMDMSISGDKTGIAGVFISGKKVSTDEAEQANDLFFTLGFATSIKAPKGRQVSFEKNRNFIYWLKDQGFNIKSITTDSFQAYDTGQTLKAKGFPYSKLSVDVVTPDHICHPYQYLKTTLYDKRIELFKEDVLETELVNLERNIHTGKIDHPEKGSKDVADALCGATWMASQSAEQFGYEFGESLEIGLHTSKMHKDIVMRPQQGDEGFDPNVLAMLRRKRQEREEELDGDGDDVFFFR